MYDDQYAQRLEEHQEAEDDTEDYEAGLYSQQQEGYQVDDYPSENGREVYNQEGYGYGTNPYAPEFIPTRTTGYQGYNAAAKDDCRRRALT